MCVLFVCRHTRCLHVTESFTVNSILMAIQIRKVFCSANQVKQKVVSETEKKLAAIWRTVASGWRPRKVWVIRIVVVAVGKVWTPGTRAGAEGPRRRRRASWRRELRQLPIELIVVVRAATSSARVVSIPPAATASALRTSHHAVTEIYICT